MERKVHWENVYKNKSDQQVSWYEELPLQSLELIEELSLDKNAAIIDVGGGNSNLTLELLKNKYTNLTVLDISNQALKRTQAKADNRKDEIQWICGDVLNFQPTFQYDLWHDRATFHFFTDKPDILKYIQIAQSSIKKNGYLILATFSMTGPKKCSGLDICQYSKETLNTLFEEDFTILKSFERMHQTPFETEQNFIYTVFQKR